MGFKVTIAIIQADGEIFELDVERDVDCLGLKVLIWQTRSIPIENQQFVYNGEQIDDSTKLFSELFNFEHEPTLYLVEPSAKPKEQQQKPKPQQKEGVVEREMVAYNVLGEDEFDGEILLDIDSEVKINRVMGINKWVRAYCHVCLVLSILAVLAMIFLFASSAIILAPAACIVVYSFGMKGTRTLKIWMLALPMFTTFTWAVFGVTNSLIQLISGGNRLMIPWWVILLMFGLFHCLVFEWFCKEIYRIKGLNCEEKKIAQKRIEAILGETCCCGFCNCRC